MFSVKTGLIWITLILTRSPSFLVFILSGDHNILCSKRVLRYSQFNNRVITAFSSLPFVTNQLRHYICLRGQNRRGYEYIHSSKSNYNFGIVSTVCEHTLSCHSSISFNTRPLLPGPISSVKIVVSISVTANRFI